MAKMLCFQIPIPLKNTNVVLTECIKSALFTESLILNYTMLLVLAAITATTKKGYRKWMERW